MVVQFKKKQSNGIHSKNIHMGVHTKIIRHDRPYKNNPHDTFFPPTKLFLNGHIFKLLLNSIHSKMTITERYYLNNTP